MIADPYPRRELLGRKELMALLSMEATTFNEFLHDPTAGFPRPVAIGQTNNGYDRLKWKKLEVYAWLDSLQHVDVPTRDRKRKRPDDDDG